MNFLDTIGIVAALAGFLIFLYHIGFTHMPAELLVIQHLYNVILLIIIFSALAGVTVKKWEERSRRYRIAELAIVPILLLILDARTGYTGIDWSQLRLHTILNRNLAIYAVLILSLIVEVSTSSLQLNNRNTNPGLLFAFSFLFIIAFGAGLLMLPMQLIRASGLRMPFLLRRALFVLRASLSLTQLPILHHWAERSSLF